MGRGGGGGGSHHSSHHSSSHSHHSSSRSSYSSRSSSGSSSHHSSRRSNYNYKAGSRYDGDGYYSGARRSGAGCGTLIFVFVLFISMAVAAFTGQVLKRGSLKLEDITIQSILNGDFLPIERSTVQRDKLPASKCDEVNFWYQDDWGTWIDDEDEEFSLRVGLKSFYEDTGVQPYLWIMGEEGKEYKSEGSLEELAEEKYKELFGHDEGHLLVIFREYPDNSGNYICTVTPGYDAETQVMDDQAKEILLDYIDYYYTDSDLNEGEFFESAFIQAGNRIMTKQMSWRQICTIVIVAIVVVIGIIIVASIIKKRKVAVAKQKAKQAEAEAVQKRAEADKKQTEFNQQQYQDALEKEYVSVTCPNCGATANKIRKGTVDYCQFCGTAMSVDMIGQAFVGDIFQFQQQQQQPQQPQQPPQL